MNHVLGKSVSVAPSLECEATRVIDTEQNQTINFPGMTWSLGRLSQKMKYSRKQKNAYEVARRTIPAVGGK